MLKKLKGWRSEDKRPLSFSLPISLNKKKNKNYLVEFRNGNAHAFSKIYKHFKKPILNYTRSRIRDEQAAQEIVQEIFLKVYRFRDSYQEQYAFSTWLWTIARNTLADHLRGLKNSEYQSGDTTDKTPTLPEDLPCPEKSAEALLERKDEKRNLLKKMKSLTRLQKRVLWLRVIHQLSYQEIARNLGLSLASVKNLAYRAKMTLNCSTSEAI